MKTIKLSNGAEATRSNDTRFVRISTPDEWDSHLLARKDLTAMLALFEEEKQVEKSCGNCGHCGNHEVYTKGYCTLVIEKVIANPIVCMMEDRRYHMSDGSGKRVE